MIGEIALANAIGVGALDIGKSIHLHSTQGKGIAMAVKVARGSCADLPPGKRQARPSCLNLETTVDRLFPA